ncbi:hypothetical protein QEN19_002452 [Hanseniaspora menglaensis]
MSFNKGNTSHDSQESDYKIYKNHLLLLANADIIIPLYQNKQQTCAHKREDTKPNQYTEPDNVSKDTDALNLLNLNDINSPNLNDINSLNLNDFSGLPINCNLEGNYCDKYSDPYTNFFNCLVENDSFLTTDSINKIINNNELKYIYYSNRLNFLTLMKFFCFKIIRLTSMLSSMKSIEEINFQFSCQTLIKCIRFLTKVIPVFFEICYSEKDIEMNEDLIFWDANTSETFQDFENLTQNATVGVADSILSLDKNGSKNGDILSSLHVEINFKAKSQSSEFSTQPNWFQDGFSKKNTMSLGISLLTSLMKILFMEGLTLPLSAENSRGNISFQLWNDGILSHNTFKHMQTIKPNPCLDSYRLTILNLVEVLCSNSLYSSRKIDNKFLGAWCCSMPEYLSVYLVNSLVNNFIEENHIIANSKLDQNNILFSYPSDYKILKLKKTTLLKTPVSRASSILSDFENSPLSKNTFNQKKIIQPQLASVIEESISIQESCKLRENYFKSSRNLLLLYFSFNKDSLCENTKLQIFNSGNDLSELSNVCKRSFATLNTLSDFKKILTSIVKVLRLPMDKIIEEENKIFVLTSKNGNGIFDYFTRGKNIIEHNISGSSNSEGSSDESKTDSEGNKDGNDQQNLPENLVSLLLILEGMLSCNEFFKIHVLEIYSNKLFVILMFYLKKSYLNKVFSSKVLPILTSLMLKISSNALFSLRSMKYIGLDYFTEKLPKTMKIIDYDLNLKSETHRDFFIYHISNMIIHDIDMNLHPKVYLYDLLNNLLLATPKHLMTISTHNINSLLQNERNMHDNASGEFKTGPSYGTCRKIIQILYAMVKNKEYLTTSSIDRQDNYQFLLQKAVNFSSIRTKSLQSSDYSTLSSKSFSNSGTEAMNSTCDDFNQNIDNILMQNNTSVDKIDVNAVSKTPYCFSLANKWNSLSLLLRSISIVTLNCYSDYKYLNFLLVKYKKIFNDLNYFVNSINIDVANELDSFQLKFLPEGVTKKSIYSTSSLKLPFDISFHNYQTIVDELLVTDDDSLNYYEENKFNSLKKLSIDLLSDTYAEDKFYYKANPNICFVDTKNSSILDQETGRRIVNSTLRSQSNDTDPNVVGGKPKLQVKTNHIHPFSVNKNKSVLEKSCDNYLQNLYNNSVYRRINCKKPLGLGIKKIKNMVLKNSDNFRQPLSTYNVPNRGFWFIGQKYFSFLTTSVTLLSSHLEEEISTGLKDKLNISINKILEVEDLVINGKIKEVAPVELLFNESYSQFIVFDDLYNSTSYQYFQTLVWRDIFDKNSLEYKFYAEEISGNAELLQNLNTDHNSHLANDDMNFHQTPSSPMLERWVSNNSLSRFDSDHSVLSLSNDVNGILDKPIEPINIISQNTSVSINSIFIKKSICDQQANTYTLLNDISQSFLWCYTNVKMFPVENQERDEYSIMDMTSNFLNKFKFNNTSVNVKTPEEFAADEIKRAYTPRSSISSMPIKNSK